MRANIAIVGSTGNAGRKTIEVLERRKFPVNILYLLASKKSVGKFIKFRNKNIEVRSLEDFDFRKADITFFCAGSKLAKTWAPKIAKDSIVIEYSSYFRSSKNIPLIVPEVNEYAIKDYKKTNIIANPNCSTAQLVVALKPLHDKFKIKRIVTSTYQSVSGAGKAAMDELISQTKDYLSKKKIKPKKFTKQIAFNVIPHIDVFMKDGSTKEEWKMENETKKILDKNIKLTATCVRVPVLVSHSEAVNVEFKKKFDIQQIRSTLMNSPSCKVIDQKKNGGYATPAESAGSFLTYISRIRRDPTKNAVNMWIVSDNLLKGAAFNAVQIAEVLVKKHIKNN
ncbi:Asd Aspartate-semialdehyde dehydrogenase [Candidatus Pelagibacterales bacterium]|jgi:aspartate-semialdehyde dehydrogenase